MLAHGSGEKSVSQAQDFITRNRAHHVADKTIFFYTKREILVSLVSEIMDKIWFQSLLFRRTVKPKHFQGLFKDLDI